MTFEEFTEFVACLGFSALLWAPERTHTTIVFAELAMLVGLFIGRRYGKAGR